MKLKLLVPTTLADITLREYQKFMQVFGGDDEYDDYYSGLKLLEIFCKVPYNDALQIKIKDLQEAVSKINKALSEKPSLINKFKLGDTEFGFIPQLDDMTFGEYIDVDNNLTDWDNMHKAMAVLYRPIKDKKNNKYEIEKYRGDNYYEAMQEMPMSVVMSSLLFFYNLETELLEVTIHSLTKESKKLISTLEQASELSGDGTIASMHSPKGTSEN
jgi:hypothetical protein